MKFIFSLLLALSLTGCSVLEDEATSIAYDIERAFGILGTPKGQAM